MTDHIHVQPAAEQRVGLARWAVAQTPKVRTVGPSAFSVPHQLFTDVPEPLLIGALIDGHRYVSPVEDAANGQPRLLSCGLCYEENGEEAHPHPDCTAGSPELLGVATREGFREAIAGEVLPDVPADAYGPDSTPLPAPDPADKPSEKPDGVFPCSGCDREFTTERGRDTHQRQKHPED
ncbi:hypothetical protein ABZ593_20830 [Streptomyces sp. NPDC012617]|uniref:hypothetical protein n=1 Tax=Streptomyces TaxID=1883 RepID=UPI0033D3EC0F